MADVSTLVGERVALKNEDQIVEPEVKPARPSLDVGRRRFITAVSTAKPWSAFPS